LIIKINIQQTYLSFFYLVGNFFYSLFYFCFILILLALGFGLTICWVGIPLVIFLFQIIEKIINKDMKFAENLLPIEYNKIKFKKYPEENLLGKFKLYITNKKIWRYIGFYLLRFPITVATFSISIFLVLVPVVLIIAPLIYNFVSYNILLFEVNSLFSALLLSVLGLGLSFIFFPILNNVALKQGALLKKID